MAILTIDLADATKETGVGRGQATVESVSSSESGAEKADQAVRAETLQKLSAESKIALAISWSILNTR
jgi:hypothetical protein